MRQIPLRNRAKEIVAYALVDDEDYERFGHLRWHRSNYGYAAHGYWKGGRSHTVFLHREILGLEHGDPREGDHVNRNRLDCQRSNLRILEPGKNAQNLTAYGRSAHRGVCWHKGKGKWMAYSRIDGRIKFIGYFDDESVAASAASVFRSEHMPYAVEDIAA